ncbi:MAG TPA: hypothetical protein VFP05_06880, partial [Thermomicrobiales bacterium]|nr:hypothetical protein [Thermomicrobiales bacterium]
MKRSVALLVFIFGFLFLLPAAALAQDASPTAGSSDSGDNPVVSATITDEDDSLLLKVNGDTAVAAGDTIQNAAVINGNITVAGTIEENLFVAKGDAVITGTVKGTVTVVRGTLTLENGSSVDDVMLIDSDLTRADGATVTGDIEDRGFD